MQAGRGDQSLAASLVAFMLRYGRRFEYDTHAVAVRQGGIVPISSVHGYDPQKNKPRTGIRIYVEDPLTFRQALSLVAHCNRYERRRCQEKMCLRQFAG